MLTYYKECDSSDTPLIVLPSTQIPEGFLAGHRIERQLGNQRWETLGYQGKNNPCTTYLRLSTGELVHCIKRPEHLTEPIPDEESLPPGITKRKLDGFVRLEPLPAGWYRIGGMEITREELRGLLPLLQADWGGVLYETGRPGYFSFWQVNGSFGNWCRYRLEREELATAEEAGPHHLLPEAGPHTLYRVHYLDPMRPGPLPGLSHQHGFCVGYNRPGGPEMLMPVELINLPDYWPAEQLKTILSVEELESVSWPANKPTKKPRKTVKSVHQP